MLTMKEIEGAQHWDFRFRLEDSDDERLRQLLSDKAALRRLLPPLVSLAEGFEVIEGLLSDRKCRAIEEERREKRRQARLAKARAARAKVAEEARLKALEATCSPEPTASPTAERPTEPAVPTFESSEPRSARWASMLYTFFGGK